DERLNSRSRERLDELLDRTHPVADGEHGHEPTVRIELALRGNEPAGDGWKRDVAATAGARSIPDRGRVRGQPVSPPRPVRCADAGRRPDANERGAGRGCEDRPVGADP